MCSAYSFLTIDMGSEVICSKYKIARLKHNMINEICDLGNFIVY